MGDSHRRRTLWRYLGTVPYAEGNALQERLRQALRTGDGPEHLLLLEHPHVYTLGRNASEADVVSDPAWRALHGVEVHECDRGGQVTYHGPGQLVGYPILNLSPDRRDIRRYVRDLQEVIIRTLADFGVEGHRREGKENIGVWVEHPEAGPAKIASIGVHLSRWLTTHGFALNLATDLSFFGGIVACGLPQVRMTSLEEAAGESPTVAAVARRLAGHFAEVFERDMVEAEADSLTPPAVAGASLG